MPLRHPPAADSGLQSVFLRERERENGWQTSPKVALNAAQCAPQASLNKLTASGVSLSAPATACNALGTNDVANARTIWRSYAPIVSSMQGRLASPARVAPPMLVNWRDFRRTGLLYLPPLSRATTTRRHRSPANNSAYFVSLSALALSQTPSTLADPGLGSPLLVTAPRKVMSTAS